MSLPRPVVPRSSMPATSEAKRIQRVQWMQRVIIVLTRGPMSLSSTARLPENWISTNRLLSFPKAMLWSWRSHSPPWSQIGQSNGWFTKRNSITPSRAFRVRSELVLTRHPFITGIAHAATGYKTKFIFLIYEEIQRCLFLQFFNLSCNSQLGIYDFLSQKIRTEFQYPALQ